MAIVVTDGNYNFLDHVNGDTYLGDQFTITDKDTGDPIDITNAYIKMQLRKNSPCNVSISKEFDNDQIGGFTIINGGNGVFAFDRQIVQIDDGAGLYYQDIEITLESGDVFTWLKGTWLILQDVTR